MRHKFSAERSHPIVTQGVTCIYVKHCDQSHVYRSNVRHGSPPPATPRTTTLTSPLSGPDTQLSSPTRPRTTDHHKEARGNGCVDAGHGIGIGSGNASAGCWAAPGLAQQPTWCVRPGQAVRA